MPDPIIPGADSGDVASADAAAEAMAAAQRNGGQAAPPTLRPDVSQARLDDLDTAFEEATGQDASTGDIVDPTKVGRENNGVRVPLRGEPTAAEKAAETQKLADEKAAADADKLEADRATAEDAAKKSAAKPARKGLLGDVIEGDEEKTDDPAKAYDDIKLRTDASDKTKESFENQRQRAIQRETAVSQKLQEEQAKRLDLEARLTELEKTKGQLPENAAKELKELREFRAAHDVAGRPEFKQKFDDQIAANENAVYELFKKEGMADELIAKLRRLDEAKRDDYFEKHVYPKLTAQQRRIVESKLMSNTTLAEEKSKALDSARADADKILSEQRTLPAKQVMERDNAVLAFIKPTLAKLDYMHVVEIPATATEAQKKEFEARNAFALELQQNLKTGIIDDSPEVRAEAALAIPIARHLSRALKFTLARAEAAEKKLAAITAAGATGRLGRSAAPGAAGAAPAPKVAGDSEDVIDQLFKNAGGKLS